MRHFHIFARLLSIIHILCKDPTSLHWKGDRVGFIYAKHCGGTVLPLVASSHFSGFNGIGLLKGFAVLSFLGFLPLCGYVYYLLFPLSYLLSSS